jgi:hypothetical protein
MGFDLIETFENAFDIAFRDANTRIDYEDLNIASTDLSLDPNLAAFIGEGDGVADKVGQRQVNLLPVAEDGQGLLRRYILAQFDTLTLGRSLHR